ncbi:MAG: MurR/RpiR family transcriptional regulator [Synergistaceae bacterium]|nr:MurR/RpiR family transcriptional regulator [Synergistaceae bacterium]
MSMHPDTGMPQKDLFARLRMGMKELPAQQRLICQYILEHYQQVAFYTVEELGAASGASPATVVRLVKRLGYDSYKSLLEELQKLFMNSNNSVWWELEQIWSGSGDTNDYEPVLSWVARDDIEAIKASLTPQLMDSFDNAVALMEKAKKIGLVGMRSSKYVAGYLHFMLNQLFSNVRMLAYDGADTVYDEVLNFGREDLIIAVSLGGPHFVQLTHQILAYAQENGIPSILIANDMGNPAIDTATVTLCAGRAKYHYSIVQPIVIAEALVTELGKRKQPLAQKKLHRLEQVLDQKGVTLP